MIDKNGPAKSGGTGIKQLRENIAESKLSYEIMDDAAQVIMIRMMMMMMMIMMIVVTMKIMKMIRMNAVLQS